jgi:hypothetical protein
MLVKLKGKSFIGCVALNQWNLIARNTRGDCRVIASPETLLIAHEAAILAGLATPGERLDVSAMTRFAFQAAPKFQWVSRVQLGEGYTVRFTSADEQWGVFVGGEEKSVATASTMVAALVEAVWHAATREHCNVAVSQVPAFLVRIARRLFDPATGHGGEQWH